MVKLKEKLNSKKDEDGLYGDLLATKLRSLSKINKLKSNHEIDNIMFRFQLQQDKGCIKTRQRATSIPKAFSSTLRALGNR